MKERHCWQCGSKITGCFGSVHAGSFLKAWLAQDIIAKVYELCPKCATVYANSNNSNFECYPNPSKHVTFP